MKDEVPLAKLRDITTKIGSGATPRGGKRSYKEKGISLIRSLNVYDLRFETKGLAYINKEQASQLDNVKVESHDILLNITGASVARCCMVPDSVLPARVNQHVSIIRVDAEKANPYYILYCLVSPLFKNQLLMLAQGGATREALTKTTIENFKVQLLERQNQDKIASILTCFDDLVEVNSRRIRILERISQSLYDEWFVHLRYTGHENVEIIQTPKGSIPKDWKYGVIGDLCKVRSGYAFKSKNFQNDGEFGIIKISNLQSNFVDVKDVQYVDSKIGSDKLQFELFEGDILIAMTGAQVGKIGIMPKIKNRFLLNQRVGKIFLKNKAYKAYLYQIFAADRTTRIVEKIALGAAQPNISGKNIENIPIVVPHQDLMQRYDFFCSPMLEEITLLLLKNDILEKIRSLILPKLISNQVNLGRIGISGD